MSQQSRIETVAVTDPPSSLFIPYPHQFYWSSASPASPATMMNYNDMSDEDKEKLNRAAGQCNFTCLFLFCTSAFVCGLTATSYCAFVSRDVTTTQGADEICAGVSNATADQCKSFFDNHGESIGTCVCGQSTPHELTRDLSFGRNRILGLASYSASRPNYLSLVHSVCGR